jgi:hypothetical protein
VIPSIYPIEAGVSNALVSPRRNLPLAYRRIPSSGKAEGPIHTTRFSRATFEHEALLLADHRLTSNPLIVAEAVGRILNPHVGVIEPRKCAAITAGELLWSRTR